MRGIIKPDKEFEDPKDAQTYNICNQSSFLNEGKYLDPKYPENSSIYFEPNLVNEHVEEMIKNTEKLEEVIFEKDDLVDYK